MSVNNILLVVGSLIIASISWLLITVSELSGDVKVIKFQVNQNSDKLSELKDHEIIQNLINHYLITRQEAIQSYQDYNYLFYKLLIYLYII